MPYYPERKPEPSGEKQRNTTAAEKRNRLLRLSVAAFFSLLFLYGAIRLFRYQSELNESRKTTAELRRIQNLEEIKTGKNQGNGIILPWLFDKYELPDDYPISRCEQFCR